MLGKDWAEAKERRSTLLVDTPASVAVHGDNWAAGRSAAARAWELWAAVAIEREIPHQAIVGVVLNRPDEAVPHVKGSGGRMQTR